MVFLTHILQAAKLRKRSPRGFMDMLRLTVGGGTGGAGLPKYGGSGGQGGCVYCIGNEKATLHKILHNHGSKRVIGGHGRDSNKNMLLGPPGEDRVLEVPLGIQIHSEKGLIGEINLEGETCLIARGGPGGTPANDYLGREGQLHPVVLELRLIADCGLVGFPNAGKSTLLKALSRAKPKIASYPFTTIKPNLGVIEYADLRQVSVADLPGLIEGAHINVGMGHRFLRHVERTRLLVIVADVNGFALSPRHVKRTCLETILLLGRELELYDESLKDKPKVLLINKMDTEGAQEKLEEVMQKLNNIEEIWDTIPADIRSTEPMQFEDVLAISARDSSEDKVKVRNKLRQLIDLTADKEGQTEEVIDDIAMKLREVGPRVT